MAFSEVEYLVSALITKYQTLYLSVLKLEYGDL